MMTALLLAVITLPIFAFLAARQPRILLALIIPAEILVGGMERGAWVPGFRVGEVILGVSMAFLVASPAWSLSRFRRHSLNGWILLLVIGALAIPLFVWRARGHVISGEAAQAYAWVARAAALYITVVPLELTEQQIVTVLLAAFWAVVASAFVAILQVLNFQPVLSLLLAYFKGPHLFERLSGLSSRATGLAANWHSLGIQFVMALVVGWQLWVSRLSRSRWLLVGMVVLVLGLWTVRTLTSAVILLGLVAVVLWRRARDLHIPRRALLVGVMMLWLALVAIVVAAASKTRGAAFATLVPATLYVRAYYWLFLYFPVIQQHLIFGYGPFMPVVNAQSDDSQIILFLLRGGLIGLVTWVAVMWRIVVLGRRAMTQGGVVALLGQVVVVFTLGLCAASTMQSFFTYTGVVEFFWVVVGMLATQEGTGSEAARPNDVGGLTSTKKPPPFAA